MFCNQVRIVRAIQSLVSLAIVVRTLLSFAKLAATIQLPDLLLTLFNALLFVAP